MMPKKMRSRQWLYPKSAVVLKAAGLHTIKQYIGKRRHTMAKYITGRPVYNMVISAKRLTGMPQHLLWTDQNLDIPEVYEAPLSSSPCTYDSAAVVQGRAHSAPPGNQPEGWLRYMDAPEGAAL